MKRFHLYGIIGLVSLYTTAQTTYTRTSSGQLVSNTKTVIPPKMTGEFIVIKDVSYPVYITSKGRLFINKVSKKTGKTYKQYITVTK